MALKNKEITGKLDGTFIGKPIYLKGSQLRPEATGYGLLYFVSNMLETYKKDTIKNKKVIISGAGNVSSFAMRKTKELGGIVVGASNSRGYICDENGIDIDYVIACAENRNNFIPKYLEKYPNTKTSNISKEETTNQIKSKARFKNLKSDYFLKKLFDIIKKNKSLEILKYNKTLQRRLKLNINDYKEYCQLYSSI